MCGIAGFIDFNRTSSKAELVQMTDTLLHRGPDSSGYEFFQNDNYSIGLGHRRLAIIDLTPAGHQPMQSADGNYWIVFNGEIYNYQEIKATLIELGHQFQSHSDTEVILHAFDEWGTKGIDLFKGMFAFIIYDIKNEKITCVRDRPGTKPIFYYWANGIFLFASELKALLAHPAFKKEIDINAVAAYLQFGYVPVSYCIYKDTYKVKQGHFVTIDLKTRELHSVQFWNVYDCYNKDKIKISMPDAIEETEKILQKSFNYRMVSDVPVGVFLSGGYDSACVTALLQKENTAKLKTFTIGMVDKELDEAPYAKQIAGILGTEHTEHYCTEKEALDIVPTLPFFYDEPFADTSAIPSILVSKIARKTVTVALSADAGDEIFAGYNNYETILGYESKLGNIPPIVRKNLAAVMKAIPVDKIPLYQKNNIFLKKYEKVASLLSASDPYSLYIHTNSYFTDKEKRKLIRQPFRDTTFDYNEPGLESKYFDLTTYCMAIDFKTYMADDILQKVDRATMSVSLEGREPLLDQDIIEWAGSLPSEYKIYNGQRKYILKQIVHKYIPESLMNRPKKGFAVPVTNWLLNELKPIFDKYFDKDFVEKQGIFDPAYVASMKYQFTKGKEAENKIWFMLMFQMWYDKWINNA